MSPKKISVAITVIILLWIMSGMILSDSRENSGHDALQSGGNIGKLIEVETIEAKPHTKTIILNGFTKANRTVAIKPEIDGKVVELPVKKGEFVKSGDLIVRLDNRDRKEKLAESLALLAAREIEYKAAQELLSKGYRPRIGAAEAKAALEQARVAVAQARLAADNVFIRAPFAGRIESLNVEIGDFLLSGFVGSMNNQTMALIVEDNPILISGHISEKDLPDINKNSQAAVTLAGGRELAGKIRYISQIADDKSRSFEVEVEVDNSNHDIPVGMTATIKLATSLNKSYCVSSSVLALDDAGKVGVKTVDDEGIVRFTNISIISDDENCLWISGLPDKINLVSKGQAFVNSGQKLPTEKSEKTSEKTSEKIPVNKL